MNDSKPFWQSKTFWTGTLLPVAIGLIPGAPQWVAANPEAFTGMVALLFIGLRAISKGAISIS